MGMVGLTKQLVCECLQGLNQIHGNSCCTSGPRCSLARWCSVGLTSSGSDPSTPSGSAGEARSSEVSPNSPTDAAAAAAEDAPPSPRIVSNRCQRLRIAWSVRPGRRSAIWNHLWPSSATEHVISSSSSGFQPIRSGFRRSSPTSPSASAHASFAQAVQIRSLLHVHDILGMCLHSAYKL